MTVRFTRGGELAQANEVELSVTPDEPVTGGSVTVAFAGAPSGEDNWITIE